MQQLELPSGRSAGSLRHLRPTTLPELLDHAFGIAQKRFWLLAALSLVGALPDLGTAIFRLVYAHTPAMLHWQYAVLFTLHVVSELAYAVAVGVCFQTALFPGRVISIDALLSATVPRLPVFVLTRLLLGYVLIAIAVVGPSVILNAPGGVRANPFTAILAAASVLLAIRLALLWSLVPFTIMVERRSFLKAMLRSSELVQTAFSPKRLRDSASLRLLMGLIPVAALVLAVAAGTQLFCHFAGRPLLSFAQVWGESPRLSGQIASGIASLVTAPLVWPLLTLIYIECRMQREGIDFQVRLIESKPKPAQSNPEALTAL